MSETTGAPPPASAPAPAPVITADAVLPPRRGRPPKSAAAPAAPAKAPTGQLGISSSAPPASQPGISVSEAARLLGQQRRGAEAAPAPAAPERKASPNDLAAVQSGTTPEVPAPAPKPATGLSALERALGVQPGGSAPEAPTTDANDGAIIEIEGQRLKSIAEVQEFARRKSADYTQKMQGLAEANRQVQAQQQALAAVLPYIQPELTRLAEAVQQAPQRPDPALIHSDPQGYLHARAAYESAMEEQQRLGSLTALQQQAHDRAMAQQVAVANEALAQEFPFWADPQERMAAQAEIVEWATSKGGFSRDELRNLTSPQQLKAMMKAAMFDRMMSGAKTTAPPQRLQAPVRGAPPPAPPSARIQQAQQAFSDKPDFRSGAALLAARRGLNGR